MSADVVSVTRGSSPLVLSMPHPGTGLPEKYNGCFFLACYKGNTATSQVAVFKPVLVPLADYRSHPAFCGLGLCARRQYGQREGRGEGRLEVHLFFSPVI